MQTINKNPLVSIITVNYNQLAVTIDLLHSLQKITYNNIEIIVVDNNSQTENPDLLKTAFENIILIKSNKNLGFAGGNNLGIKRAKGKYVLFINNDVEVTKDFLEPLVNLFETDKEIGMISPKIRFHHTPDTIQYAGYTPMNKITIRQNLIGYRQKDKGQFDTTKQTYSIHGAAMMLPMKIIKEVGMMADIYFLYYEEHDWCFRIKKAGYKVYYQANSLVFHKESISTGKDSPLKIHYISRNRILYARRNYNGFTFLLNLIYLSIIAIPKNSLMYLLKGKFTLFKAYWKGVFWNLTHFKNIHFNPKLE